MEGSYTIGVDAGGSKVAYGLFDGHGQMIDRLQHPTAADADGPGFSDVIIDNVKAILSRNHLVEKDLSGIGVCMPSYILYDEGRILMTSSMPGIKEFLMRDYLRVRLNTRVVLDNDANGAALAEYRCGAGRGARHMVYIVLGTGLGSGVIIDGKLFQGSYGWAGECGHMLATPGEGLVCGCENRGCFMSKTSGKHIPDRVRAGILAGAVTIMAPETADGYVLKEAYMAGDPLARELVGEMADWLAVCVFNVYQMLNIDMYVFGGGLLSLGDLLFDRLRETFDSYNHLPVPVHFKLAELGEDIGIIGAANLVK